MDGPVVSGLRARIWNNFRSLHTYFILLLLLLVNIRIKVNFENKVWNHYPKVSNLQKSESQSFELLSPIAQLISKISIYKKKPNIVFFIEKLQKAY